MACVRVQVQQQWFNYTEKVDHMVEEALRLNVKWSLQELSRAINGDGKSGANPLFKVQVILENDKVCPGPFSSIQFSSLLAFVVGSADVTDWQKPWALRRPPASPGCG